MKIRYYLRGLGLGIVFTAVFFLLSDDGSKTMSDEMVKARAKELGMIENVVLAEIVEGTSEETTPETKVAETKEETVEVTSEEMTAQEESSVPEEVMETEGTSEESSEEPSEESSEETSEERSEESSVVPEESSETEAVLTDGRSISIQVNNGDGSDTVSKRLFEAGLVTDPYEYDRYLMENGYDRKIRAGEHQIPANAQWQEMAEILCNMR